MKNIEDEIRVETVHKNKDSALIAMNLIYHTEGEIVRIRYLQGSKIGVLVGIGTGDGIGPGFYSLISDQSIPLITSILDTKPDVSETISGAIYLYHTLGGPYKLYYILGDDLTDSDITESFYFTCLSDGKYYYYDAVSQRLVDVSKNLSDKASFLGIINITEEGYESLGPSEIRGDYIYLVNNGEKVTNLWYNGMPIEFEMDELPGRVKDLEDKVSELTKLSWEDE